MDERIAAIRQLFACAHQARMQQMGLYSDGPFTRVNFYIQRGHIQMHRMMHCPTGSAVHYIYSI